MPKEKENYVPEPGKLATADQASKVVLDNYERSKTLLVDKKRDQWEEHYKAYRSVLEIKDDTLISRLVVPVVFTSVEDILPRLVANRPRIEVWGRGEEDEARAAGHKTIIFHLWDALGMTLKMIDFVKAAEIYGTAWFKVLYRKKVEERLVREVKEKVRRVLGIPVGMDQSLEWNTKEIPVFDGVWITQCELDQVFPDPDAKDENDAAWIIHRVPTTLRELRAARKDNKPLYDDEALNELEKRLMGKNPIQDTGERTIRQMVREDFDNASARGAPDPHKRQIHILEQWEDDRVTVVVEEYPQIKPIRNEFNETGDKPFVRYTPIPLPGEIYGMGLSEVLLSLMVETSLLHSVNLDNLMYSAHQMWKILRTSGINPRNLRFRPGGHVWVKDMGDIQPMEKSFTDFALYRTTDEIRRWIQKAGTTDTFSGVRSDLTGRTATEAQLLAEASGSKAALMFQILGEQTLRPLGRKIVRNNELFMTEAQKFRVLGDDFSPAEFQTVTPEELVSGTGLDLDVVIDVAETEPMTRTFRLLRAKDMLQALGAILPPNHPVMEFVLSELLRGYGKDRPEQLVTSDQARLISSLGVGQGAGAASNVESLAEQLAVDAGGPGGTL